MATRENNAPGNALSDRELFSLSKDFSLDRDISLILINHREKVLNCISEAEPIFFESQRMHTYKTKEEEKSIIALEERFNHEKEKQINNNNIILGNLETRIKDLEERRDRGVFADKEISDTLKDYKELRQNLIDLQKKLNEATFKKSYEPQSKSKISKKILGTALATLLLAGAVLGLAKCNTSDKEMPKNDPVIDVDEEEKQTSVDDHSVKEEKSNNKEEVEQQENIIEKIVKEYGRIKGIEQFCEANKYDRLGNLSLAEIAQLREELKNTIDAIYKNGGVKCDLHTSSNPIVSNIFLFSEDSLKKVQDLLNNTQGFSTNAISEISTTNPQYGENIKKGYSFLTYNDKAPDGNSLRFISPNQMEIVVTNEDYSLDTVQTFCSAIEKFNTRPAISAKFSTIKEYLDSLGVDYSKIPNSIIQEYMPGGAVNQAGEQYQPGI